MPAFAKMQNGYRTATKTIGTPREVEYQLLSDVTGRLTRACRNDGDFRELAAALHDNLMIWQTFAIDIAENGNGLPEQLRAQLFYLYEFASVHTPKVMRREADAAPLVDINTAVMRGLRQAATTKGTDQCPV